MDIQLIRHATLFVTMKDRLILIDPMLGDVGNAPPVPNTANQVKNPLVPLPTNFQLQQLQSVDAIIITHTHRDHFDDAAARLLPKHIPVFCQPEDEEKLLDSGFNKVIPIPSSITWEGITLVKTNGEHGTGEIGKAMAPVSGFALVTEGEPTLYIAGDSIWCSFVKEAMDTYKPEITIVNAGAAQFLVGDPITMTKEDIVQICTHAPNTKIVAVHMDSINHCSLTRKVLRDHLMSTGHYQQVCIPEDGETLRFLC